MCTLRSPRTHKEEEEIVLCLVGRREKDAVEGRAFFIYIKQNAKVLRSQSHLKPSCVLNRGTGTLGALEAVQ